MNIHRSRKFPIAYVQLPFKRNQDVIKVFTDRGSLGYMVSVVDGWNYTKFVEDDDIGRKAAVVVADQFPKTFMDLTGKNFRRRAEKAAETVDRKLLTLYPKYVSCVGTFLFEWRDKTVIVFVGKGVVLLWRRGRWEKPREIGDYSLDETNSPIPNDVSRFFGRGELKRNPLYLVKPDVAVCSPQTPVLIATDGIEDVMSLEDLNNFTTKNKGSGAKDFLADLADEIKKWGSQRDDISILIRGKLI